MTNKQTLEKEILSAVQRFRINERTGLRKGLQLGMIILAKYAPLPAILKPFGKEQVQGWKCKSCGNVSPDTEDGCKPIGCWACGSKYLNSVTITTKDETK